jgi:hypothetical protein
MVVYGPDGQPAEEDATGTVAFTSLSAQSAVGNGLTMVGGAARLNHAMWIVPTAGVTAGAVQLQGSLDNVNFVNLGEPVTVTGPFSGLTQPSPILGQPLQYLRAVIATAIVGGSVTVLVASV